MANIRVKMALERIERELAAVTKHTVMYSGISASEAMSVERTADNIALMAAEIGAMARGASGNKSGSGTVKRVRKALGYTY